MKKLAILPFLLLACSSNTPKSIDSKNSEKISIAWNRNHLQKMVNSIVSEIRSSKNNVFSKNKVYAFGRIKNETHEPELETKEISNSIVTILVKDGYRFITNYDVDNPKHHIDGIFTGTLSSDYHQNKSQKKMFFKFNLNFSDTCTATNSFAFKEIEVGNKSTKKLFGW